MIWYRLRHPLRAFKAWRFGRALDRFYAQLPDSWKALSDEEQEAAIRRVVHEVRAERALVLTNSASFSEVEAANR